MRAFLVFAIALLLPAALPAQVNNPHIASTPPLAPEEQLKKFQLPRGFVIELVAAEPKIKKPINIAFDAMGRLWVTESVEYPYAAPPERVAKDTVKIVADFGSTGLASSISTFADGLNIPIGVLPGLDGKSALLYSIPNIYLVTAPEQNARADRAPCFTAHTVSKTPMA